jgi:hypothetical protein
VEQLTFLSAEAHALPLARSGAQARAALKAMPAAQLLDAVARLMPRNANARSRASSG